MKAENVRVKWDELGDVLAYLNKVGPSKYGALWARARNAALRAAASRVPERRGPTDELLAAICLEMLREFPELLSKGEGAESHAT